MSKRSNKDPIQTQSMDYSRTDEFAGEYKEDMARHSQNIHVGDQVIMTNRYNVPNEIKGIIWTVIEAPKFVNGKRRVRLDGYKELYPADGLRIVG